LTNDRFQNTSKSYSFDGITNRIDLSNSQNFSFATSDFTINIWFYSPPMNGNNRHAIRNINYQTGTYYELSPENSINGLPSFGYIGGGPMFEAFSNGLVVDNNIWHMMTGMKKNNFIYFYLDGNIQSSVNVGATTTGMLNSLQVGSFYYNNGSGPITHKIDDIGIWNRALDSCEIKDLYFASLGNCCSAAFNTQPQSVNTTTGLNASFVAQSTSLNAIYQWQTNVGLGWQNLSNAGQYNGVTNDTLIVSNLTSTNNQQLFRCVLTSGNCSDTSSQALLNVCDGFATQPSSLNAVVAQNASFIISSLANNPSYQWQSDLGLGWQNLSNAGQYSGVNNDTLVVTNLSSTNNNQLFRCILMSGTCSDTSATATLSVSQTNGLNTLQNEIISIYPNPATNQITILSNAARYPLSYKVYNELGQALLIGDLKASTTSIDISSLAPGNYMLVVGTKHVSFVKNKI
jgi:hypothetical protein